MPPYSFLLVALLSVTVVGSVQCVTSVGGSPGVLVMTDQRFGLYQDSDFYASRVINMIQILEESGYVVRTASMPSFVDDVADFLNVLSQYDRLVITAPRVFWGETLEDNYNYYPGGYYSQAQYQNAQDMLITGILDWVQDCNILVHMGGRQGEEFLDLLNQRYRYYPYFPDFGSRLYTNPYLRKTFYARYGPFDEITPDYPRGTRDQNAVYYRLRFGDGYYGDYRVGKSAQSIKGGGPVGTIDCILQLRDYYYNPIYIGKEEQPISVREVDGEYGQPLCADLKVGFGSGNIFWFGQTLKEAYYYDQGDVNFPYRDLAYGQYESVQNLLDIALATSVSCSPSDVSLDPIVVGDVMVFKNPTKGYRQLVYNYYESLPRETLFTPETLLDAIISTIDLDYRVRIRDVPSFPDEVEPFLDELRVSSALLIDAPVAFWTTTLEDQSGFARPYEQSLEQYSVAQDDLQAGIFDWISRCGGTLVQLGGAEGADEVLRGLTYDFYSWLSPAYTYTGIVDEDTYAEPRYGIADVFYQLGQIYATHSSQTIFFDFYFWPNVTCLFEPVGYRYGYSYYGREATRVEAEAGIEHRSASGLFKNPYEESLKWSEPTERKSLKDVTVRGAEDVEGTPSYYNQCLDVQVNVGNGRLFYFGQSFIDNNGYPPLRRQEPYGQYDDLQNLMGAAFIGTDDTFNLGECDPNGPLPSMSPTPSVTASRSMSSSASVTPSNSKSSSTSFSASMSFSASTSVSAPPSASMGASPSLSASKSFSASKSVSAQASPSMGASPSLSASKSVSSTISQSSSASRSVSPTPSDTSSTSLTPSKSGSQSQPPSSSPTISVSPSTAASLSPSPSLSATSSKTPSKSASGSESSSESSSASASISGEPNAVEGPQPATVLSATPTRSASIERSPSASPGAPALVGCSVDNEFQVVTSMTKLTGRVQPIDIRSPTGRIVGQVIIPPHFSGSLRVKQGFADCACSKVQAPLLDLTLISSSGEVEDSSDFENKVKICLETRKEFDPDDVCMAFYGEGDFCWKCLPQRPWIDENKRICAATGHFTTFSVLLDSNNGGGAGDSGDSSPYNNVYVWLSVGFVCLAIIVSTIAIIAYDIHFRRKRAKLTSSLSVSGHNAALMTSGSGASSGPR